MAEPKRKGGFSNKKLARKAGRLGGLASRRKWTKEEREAQSKKMKEHWNAVK